MPPSLRDRLLGRSADAGGCHARRPRPRNGDGAPARPDADARAGRAPMRPRSPAEPLRRRLAQVDPAPRSQQDRSACGSRRAESSAQRGRAAQARAAPQARRAARPRGAGAHHGRGAAHDADPSGGHRVPPRRAGAAQRDRARGDRRADHLRGHRPRADRAAVPRRARSATSSSTARRTSTSSAAASCRATNVTFRDNAHLLTVIDRIVSRVGRRVDESSPMVDARLPDGSRVNAIIPPLALDGPVLSIRRFGAELTAQELVDEGRDDRRDAARCSPAACMARLNILISGGTGSGKTTLLNALSSFIPTDRARRDDRGRGRAAAAAGPRRPPRDAPAERRGARRGDGARPREERAAHASRPHHPRRGARGARRSTCSRR